MSKSTGEFRFKGRSLAELTALVTATSGETFETLSPLTGAPLARIPLSDDADVVHAIETARDHQPNWAKLAVADRAARLLRFHDLLLDNQAALLDLICLDSGKTRMDAYTEVVHLTLTARYYAVRGPALLRGRRALALLPVVTRVGVSRVPKGVVGLITPWNYPLTMAICDGLAALLAGNTVVHKPASETVLSALAGVALLRAAGIPAEAWQVVAGPGPRIGPQLVDQTDMICFTGSTETGRTLAAATGAQLKSITAEAGGKNPAIVLADADIQAAADGLARACFDNAGQLCVHIERIYVADAIADQFQSVFVAAVSALKLAPGLGWDAEVGTLISPAQLEKVTEHLADARARGATVLCGGRARPDLAPWCHEPTVLTGVTREMTCYLDETFGPLVSLYRFGDEDEAVHLANQGEDGLNASIWTRDHARGRRIAARLRAGSVNINDGYEASLSAIDAPMGGMGTSGMGRRQGREGVYRFTEPQTVATQRLIPLAPFGGLDARGFARFTNGVLRVQRRLRLP